MFSPCKPITRRVECVKGSDEIERLALHKLLNGGG
jgi:hypothetical protein